MTVYILSTGSHSDWTILGIYSNREKAEADKAVFERDRKFDGEPDDVMRFSCNPIREIELDARQEYHGGGYFNDEESDTW